VGNTVYTELICQLCDPINDLELEEALAHSDVHKVKVDNNNTSAKRKEIKGKSRGDQDRSSKKHENGINEERLVNQLVKAHSSTE
jgi:hypothetical protein